VRQDSGDGAFGVGGSHPHALMVGTGAHAIGNDAGEFTLALSVSRHKGQR
jgi:hypothetical protein